MRNIVELSTCFISSIVLSTRKKNCHTDLCWPEGYCDATVSQKLKSLRHKSFPVSYIDSSDSFWTAFTDLEPVLN